MKKNILKSAKKIAKLANKSTNKEKIKVLRKELGEEVSKLLKDISTHGNENEQVFELGTQILVALIEKLHEHKNKEIDDFLLYEILEIIGEVGANIKKANNIEILLESLQKTALGILEGNCPQERVNKFVLPIIVKKDVLEGRRRDYLIYNINQTKKIVNISNRKGKKIKEIKYKNNLFDLFSLIYYFRARPEQFGNDFVFDFLEEKSIRTVHFKRDKNLNVVIPTISRKKAVKAISITQIGGIGINIIVGRDIIRLPLKMIVPSKLPGNRKLNVIFSISKFTPGDINLSIPSYYRKIVKH